MKSKLIKETTAFAISGMCVLNFNVFGATAKKAAAKPAYAASNYNLYINGKKNTAKLISANSDIYIPLKALINSYLLSISQNSKNKTVNIAPQKSTNQASSTSYLNSQINSLKSEIAKLKSDSQKLEKIKDYINSIDVNNSLTLKTDILKITDSDYTSTNNANETMLTSLTPQFNPSDIVRKNSIFSEGLYYNIDKWTNPQGFKELIINGDSYNYKNNILGWIDFNEENKPIRLTYTLDGKYTKLTGLFAIDDMTSDLETGHLKIKFLDDNDNLIKQLNPIAKRDSIEIFDIDLSGKSSVTLEISSNNDIKNSIVYFDLMNLKLQ